MTSPFIPNSFTYGDAPQGGAVMPMVIAARNPSNTIDKQYAAGYLWLSSLDLYQTVGGVPTYGSGNLYYQAGNSAGTPNWVLISDSSGTIVGINGTTNQITATNSSGTVTLTIPSTFIAPGSIAATTTVTATLGAITATNGNLVLGTAGNKVSIATGSNASVGTSVAMTAGTVTINTTAVSANSIIFLTANTPGGTPGILSAPAASRVAGTSFVINSSSNTDTSTVNWWIVN